MTPTVFLSLVRARAVALLVTAAHKGVELDYNTAEKAAAREVAAEARERRKQYGTTITTSSWDGISVKGAAAEFMRRINLIGERLREGRALGLDRRAITATPGNLSATDKFPRVKPRETRAKPQSPLSRLNGSPEVIGVYAGNDTGAQLIPDSEFAPSHHDHVTSNWRRSIEHNATVEKERRERWLALLAERRARS
jgi:hypothetical protein